MRYFFMAPVVLAFSSLAGSAQAAITLKLSGFEVGSSFGTGEANSASNASLSRTLQWQVSSSGSSPALDNNVVTKDIAGQFYGTIDKGDGAGSKSFTAYCVELNQSFGPFPSTAPVTYEQQSGSTYFSSTVNSNVGKLFSEGIVFNTAEKTAAFQIALWETIYEKSGVFAVGDAAIAGNAKFMTYAGGTASAQTFALAQTYLDAIATTQNNAALTVYTNATQQDLIVATLTAVPEPSTTALLLAGLAGVAFIGTARASGRQSRR